MELRAKIGSTAASVYAKVALSTFTDVIRFRRKTIPDHLSEKTLIIPSVSN